MWNFKANPLQIVGTFHFWDASGVKSQQDFDWAHAIAAKYQIEMCGDIETLKPLN